MRRDAEGQRRALAQASEQVQRIIAALEGLITELHPTALDQLGVQPAIENLIDRVRQRNDLRVEIDFDLAPDAGRLAPDIEATIYRVVQESLNNIVKHAGADAARVAVIEQDGAVAVTVEDDGRGIGAVGKDRNGGGFGLLGMRERVELAGGEINIGPGVGGGTRLRVRLPAVHES